MGEMDEMARVVVPVGVRTKGLTEKLDLINRAIDLFRQADDLIEQASQVTVEVLLGEPDDDSES